MGKNKVISPRVSGLKKILDTTEDLFARSGYERVSRREIAQLTQVSKALIYYHFKNKKDLYDSLIRQGMDALSKQPSQAMNVGQNPNILPARGFWKGVDSELKVRLILECFWLILLEKCYKKNSNNYDNR